MKKTIFVLLSIAAAAAYFAGCSSDEPQQDEKLQYQIGTENGKCKEDGSCDGSLFCIANKCQKVDIETTETEEMGETIETCATTSDCKKGQMCQEGKCVVMLVAPECKADQDCPADNTCVAGACQPKEPATDQPSAGGEIVAGECKTDVDCKEPGTFCSSGKCVIKPPTVSIKCVADENCTPIYGEGAKCAEGTCVSATPAGGHPPVSAAIAIDAKARPSANNAPTIKGTVYKATVSTGIGDKALNAPIDFPDKNLKKAIKAALQGDANEKPITKGECLTLKELTASGLQITNVEGIQNCSNLEFLDISFNSIESLEPLKSMKKLSALWLDFNPISSLKPISALPHLTELSLNGVETVKTLSDVGKLNLKRLYLGSKKISNLSPLLSPQITWTKTLYDLYLNNNDISDISVLKEFASLKKLFLPFNNVSDIFPLLEIPELKTRSVVDLTNNPLSEKAITDIKTLKTKGVTVFYDKPDNSDAWCDNHMANWIRNTKDECKKIQAIEKIKITMQTKHSCDAQQEIELILTNGSFKASSKPTLAEGRSYFEFEFPAKNAYYPGSFETFKIKTNTSCAIPKTLIAGIEIDLIVNFGTSTETIPIYRNPCLNRKIGLTEVSLHSLFEDTVICHLEKTANDTNAGTDSSVLLYLRYNKNGKTDKFNSTFDQIKKHNDELCSEVGDTKKIVDKNCNYSGDDVPDIIRVDLALPDYDDRKSGSLTSYDFTLYNSWGELTKSDKAVTSLPIESLFFHKTDSCNVGTLTTCYYNESPEGSEFTIIPLNNCNVVFSCGEYGGWIADNIETFLFNASPQVRLVPSGDYAGFYNKQGKTDFDHTQFKYLVFEYKDVPFKFVIFGKDDTNKHWLNHTTENVLNWQGGGL